MTTVPVAFDEAKYPIRLSPQQRAVVALARQQGGEVRTRDLVEAFGWSRQHAHQVLYRLRKKGVFKSVLLWATTKNGIHVFVKGDDGKRKLFSWLECTLQPMKEWGSEPDPGEFCSQFWSGKGKENSRVASPRPSILSR